MISRAMGRETRTMTNINAEAETLRNVFRPQRGRSQSLHSSSFPRDGGAYANAPVTDINSDKLKELSLSLSLSLSLALAMSPLSLSRSLLISGGAVTVTIAAVEARHTHSIFDLMRGGDGRILFACHGGQQHGRDVHLMTTRLLRLLLRLPSSSAAAPATDHDTSNRALFKYRDAVCVILATYIGARYNLFLLL